MNTTVFSENMKKFRIARKYTQEEVAEKLSVTAQSVSRWECGTTLPDVLLLPEIAKLYGVMVDDLFKKHSVAYENYAQRLSALYDTSKDPEDFLRCRLEYQKIMRSGELSTYEKWDYGWLHMAMMYYCKEEALKWFDAVLADKTDKNSLPYRRSATMKQGMLFSFGKGEEILKERQREMDEANGDLDEREWCLLIEAYDSAEQYEKAISTCTDALQKYPDNWELYLLEGLVYFSMEKYEKAIECYEKSGEIGTPFCDEKYQIAWCYRKLEKFNEAYQVYLEIADIHRKNGYDVEADQALGYAKEIEDKISI
ncbi:MAG: helix-turn-helix domain-containing protein [Ruminococcaceae bacterium]|nr:helix-turn-helix domain-containing protein [Oscillospiraceae bacterium]